MCDMASQYESEMQKCVMKEIRELNEKNKRLEEENKKLKEKIGTEERIGTGCWIEGFGNIDMYFENDMPIEDIDLSDIKCEEIKNAVLKATDLIFKCIELEKE